MSLPGVTSQSQAVNPVSYGQPVILDANAARAAKLQSAKGSCPNCGSGNYVQPPDTRMAMRCFDCGFTSGRQVNDLDTFAIAPPDGRTVHVKQVESLMGPRYGRTAAEIAQANAILEQSLIGR
jgi:transposase-like protein